MDYLSMGMTNDYELAIEEGSNMIRVGSAIFGKEIIRRDIMSNFMDKIKYFIGVQDLEDEEVNEDYEEYEEDYDVAVPTKTKKLNNKVVNIHTNSNMKIIVHEPLSYDEAPSIIDDLKSRKNSYCKFRTIR